MDVLSKAIYEIHYINHISKSRSLINQIHPLMKLIVTICYIMILTSFPKYELSRTLLMTAYPIIILNSIEISVRKIFKRIWPIFLLASIIGLLNPIFDQTPMMIIGNFIITGGMISAVTLMIKGILAVLASILLIMTTGIEGICYAMRMLHISNIFVTQILLTYRYIVVLLEEAAQIYQAYCIRAPRQRGIHIKVWGSLIGQLLFRSIDRANVLFESMLIRGYKGEFSYVNKRKLITKDYLFLFFNLTIFLILRYF